MPAKKLLDQAHDKICPGYYSLSTENIYISWIKQYIIFNSKRYLIEIGASEVNLFLSDNSGMNGTATIFNLGPHLVLANHYRELRQRAFAYWKKFTLA